MTVHGSAYSFEQIVLVFIAGGLTLFHLWNRNASKMTRRDFSFFAGTFLILFLGLLPAGFLGNGFPMSSRMVESITLLLIVPPLLLSGANEEFLESVMNVRTANSIGRYLLHPIAAWVIGMSAMWIWQFLSAASSVAGSPLMQSVHDVLFLILGSIFIWPVFSPLSFMRLPHTTRAFYLFTACSSCTVLGIAITFGPSAWFGEIVSRSDQQISGLIMWVPACLIYITNIMISLGRWFRTAESIRLDEDETNEAKLAQVKR
jgi:putative membrane protein